MKMGKLLFFRFVNILFYVIFILWSLIGMVDNIQKHKWGWGVLYLFGLVCYSIYLADFMKKKKKI